MLDTIKIIKKYFFEVIMTLILVIMYKDSFPPWFKEWSTFDSFYGLGFFVIGFNIYYIKTNFPNLREIKKAVSFKGIWLIIPALLLYVIGVRANLDYLVCLSLPTLISGIILSLCGFEFFKKLLTPLVLLTLILPIFPLHRITMPLQLLSTKISSEVLKILGIHSFNEGNILYVNNFRLAVVAGCSGLKSLFSLIFVTIIYSYFEKINLPKKFLYIFMAIPLAIGMNVIRIVVTALYSLYNGYHGLEKFHDVFGIVIDLISILLIIFIIRSNENKEELPEKTTL